MKSTLQIIQDLRSKIADLEDLLEKTGNHFRCDCCEQLKPEKDFHQSDTCIDCEEGKAGYRNIEGAN